MVYTWSLTTAAPTTGVFKGKLSYICVREISFSAICGKGVFRTSESRSEQPSVSALPGIFIDVVLFAFSALMLSRLGSRKGIRPVKISVMG